jgi:hypothetical protein
MYDSFAGYYAFFASADPFKEFARVLLFGRIISG